MMFMPKESPRRRKISGPSSPRTRLPKIVGDARETEEGGYQDSPTGTRTFDPNGAYDDDFEDGVHSDDGGTGGRGGSTRDLELSSRAWEDGDAQEDKDPLEPGFRELRILAQAARKKAGTKEFEKEMNALEVKMKRLQVHAAGEYATVHRQLKAQKKSNASLQQALKGAKLTVDQTVTQAYEDVTLLTQKLKTVEADFSQVRVDKEHIEKGFRSELAAVQAKNSSLQKNLLSCKLELEDMAHVVKQSEEKIRHIKFDKDEAQKEAASLRGQMAVFEDDLTAAK